MARSYVFLVHGVGKHPAGTWADSWKSSLIKELQRYAPYRNLTPTQIESEVIAFRPISYDSVFEGYRHRWGKLAGALNDADIIDNGAVKDAIEWVAGHDDTDDKVKRLFWDKALDVLLWMAFPEARAAVVATVNKQLVDGLIEMRKENGPRDSAHIMAHSLGTSVVHDSVLCLEAADRVHDGSFDARRFRWDSLFMIANTSHALEPRQSVSDDLDTSDFDVYTSDIRPGFSTSVCRSYFNVRHVADPITWVRRFDAAGRWPSDPYLNIEVVRYDELPNVHNLTDYVAAPQVHLNLFRKLLGDSRLGDDDEIDSALADHARTHPRQAATEFDNLRRMLGGDFEKQLTPRELVAFLIEVYKEVKT